METVGGIEFWMIICLKKWFFYHLVNYYIQNSFLTVKRNCFTSCKLST